LLRFNNYEIHEVLEGDWHNRNDC